MNQKITSFYRLTEQEKDRLVEQCREEIQARKVREIEETRKILEELLEAKLAKKENNRMSKLERKLEAARAQSGELRGELTTSKKQITDLQECLTVSEKHSAHMLQKLADYEEEIQKMKRHLPKKRFVSGLAGCLAGLLLATVIGVFAVPVRYVESNSGNQTLWCTDKPYLVSYGRNVLGEVSGCLYVKTEGEIQFVELALNGGCVWLWDYCFPDGGIYCGMGDFDKPRGFGIYTYSDGERSFGFWDYAEDMEYVMNNETYRYTGMLRWGEPHGYGVLEDSAGNRCFSGEFSEGMTIRGEWLPEDETSSDDNAEVSEGQENKGNEKG